MLRHLKLYLCCVLLSLFCCAEWSFSWFCKSVYNRLIPRLYRFSHMLVVAANLLISLVHLTGWMLSMHVLGSSYPIHHIVPNMLCFLSSIFIYEILVPDFSYCREVLYQFRHILELTTIVQYQFRNNDTIIVNVSWTWSPWYYPVLVHFIQSL
jgi:hypothetical protein